MRGDNSLQHTIFVLQHMRQVFIKQLIIALCGFILFVPFLGNVHLFDWDEANFAESAREMLVTKSYLRVQVDFQPFWEKPPLFIWMQAVFMKLFGIGAFAARLPNALTGIVTLCTLFYAGRKVSGERMAWWWVILYAASWLPHFYFKSGIIDPSFNLFIFLSFFQVWRIRTGSRQLYYSVLAGIFLGLATLTKGPVAILVAMLCLMVYIALNKGLWGYKLKYFLVLSLACLLTVSLWFGTDILLNGWWFTNNFIAYQVKLFSTEDAGHGGPFYYHFIVLLIGCFPASVFLFQAGKKSTATLMNNPDEKDFTRWMWILFAVTLLLFSIVKTKIVHYSSLCYFPLTFIAAQQLNRISEGKVIRKKLVTLLMASLGILLALLITLLPVAGVNKNRLIPYVKDEFTRANLQAGVNWSYLECGYGLLYLAGVIIALVLIKRSFDRGMLVLAAVQVLIIQACILHFTPKIEAFSQRAAIDYYRQFAGKDVYLQPLGFKSYAYLFYSEKQPLSSKAYYREGIGWLLTGKTDKPVHFISKITAEKEILRQFPQLEKTGSLNGYVFYRRKNGDFQ